jgi:hypothetical protein
MTEQYQQKSINLSCSNGGGGGRIVDLSVNAASVVGGYGDGSVVMSSGARLNPAGAFSGGGVGNKSIFGVFGFSGAPISQFHSLEFVWTNVTGPAGVNYLPPEPTTVLTPYVNFVVDFDPNGSGDIRVLVICTDQLNPAINNAVGSQVNNGSNELTYSWDGNSMDVLIVLSPPNPVPGGVAPNVSVGPSWLENSYSWQSIVSANPDAILIDAFSGDGGLPAGVVTPAIMLASGDSGNVTRSGKKIISLSINGESIFG